MYKKCILQFSIKKENNRLYLQINEQSEDIHFTSKVGHSLRCASYPEISSNTFYLRGNNKNLNEKWISLREEYIPSFVNGLEEFINSSKLSYIFNNENYLILSLYEEYEDIVEDKTMKYNKELFTERFLKKIVCLEDFQIKSTNMSELLECSQCKLKLKDCKKIANVNEYLIICKDCKEKLSSCSECKKLVPELITHTNSLGKVMTICTNCHKFFTCDECGFNELRNYRNLFISIDGNGNNFKQFKCLKCVKDCNKCNNYENDCSKYYPAEYESCPCSIPLNFKDIGIYDYNQDVLEILNPDSRPEIGMEIEVGVSTANRRKYEEVYKHTLNIIGKDAIIVYDSSIDFLDGKKKQQQNKYRGFEIVTRPFNYDNMIEFINKLCEKRHPLLRSWDVKTTGIHIHFNKKELSKIEIGKLSVFINKATNRNLIKHIARRLNTDYAKFGKKKISDYNSIITKNAIAIQKNICHYEALNVTKPHTIEFRIFRGSLNKETILSYIQFVYSLIEFIRSVPPSEFTSSKYIKYILQTQRSKYRELKKRLATYGRKQQLEIGGEE